MPSQRRSAFALTKWYLDCVAPDGRVLVAYRASLAWRSLKLTWHAFTVYESGRPPRQRASRSASSDPERREGGVVWRAPRLGCTFEAESTSSAVAATLLETELGAVEWECEAPATRVSVSLSDAPPIVGTGYVERLTMTIAPWRLPISELRWGRWISEGAERSVVWIDWRGETPVRWVYFDGCRALETTVMDASVIAGNARLTLAETRTLHSRSLRKVFDGMPALRAAVPASLLRWRETKWCSTGMLDVPGATSVHGHAIHESVVMR